ncbi:hypothetical protein C5S53_04550 [Methanophagales archaeon]|nr:hypothetical protein C5S53_04550 [Methanophagales archaeon]
MSGQEELTNQDPFAEDEEVPKENLISTAMVKKATYHIHKLAEQKGKEYKDIQKNCRSLFKYENLAKVSKEKGHAIINKLIELTGGEEEKPQLPTKPDDGLKNKGAKVTDDGTKSKKIEEPKNEEKEIVVSDDDTVTGTMREAIRAAVDITMKEVVEKEVPVQGLGGFVLEIGKVIFDAKMAEEASG